MKLVYSMILLLSAQLVLAQNKGKAEFEQSSFDFGEIKEEDGPVTHEFRFKNSGTAPLIITNVKASCGCTTPAWTKEPVMPSGEGFIKAQYNPMNRPGAFNKTLTITNNGEQPTVRLNIKGKVIPRIKTVEEQLRTKIGGMRIKNRTVNMGRITTQKPKTRTIEVYNDSDAAFSFTDKVEAPAFVKLSFSPQTLAPKAKGAITITYNPDFEDNLGLQNHAVKFYTDEAQSPEKKLNVMATINEYFPPMSSEERLKAPKLSIAKRTIDLGKLTQAQSKEAVFTLTNAGKSDLNIRKVASNCDCIETKLDKYDLKPGESATLSAVFHAEGRVKNQLKAITLYTNDPLGPTQMVTVKASVEAVK